MPDNMPSYFNWNYTMPSLGPNGELTGGPDPYADQADPSKGTDIRWSNDTWQHLDPHLDRNGNYDNPTIFMSDSLPDGHAAAFKDTDEYGHIGRVFRTDRNRAIGKILAMVGGGALAANMLPGAAGGVGDIGSEGYGITSGFADSAGMLEPIEVGASQLAGGTAGGFLGGLGGSEMAAFPALVGAEAAGAGTLAGVAPSGLPSGVGGYTPAGAGMASGDAGVSSAGGSGGILGQMKDMFTKGIYNPDGSVNWMNAIKLGTGVASSLGSLAGKGNAQTQPTMPAGWNDPAQFQSMHRDRTAPMSADEYANYGTTGGQHRFFTDPTYGPRGATAAPELVNDPSPNMHLPDMSLQPVARRAGGGGVRGPGSGRSDDIDARLSDGEYVIDAESVALLGDGSSAEGSRRLDALRTNLRKHKGAALTKGKFSPAAKDPMHYMHKAKGGLVPHIDVPRQNRQRMISMLERRGTPDSGKFDTMTDAELEEHRQWLENLKNLSPPVAKAKGGLTSIEGGIPVDPRMRLEQLANAQRTAAALRQKAASELTPPSPAILDDRARVDAARQRLKLIRSMADSTPPPLAKAEGGSVKALTQFADRLQDEHVDEPELIETP
jgi:hypothetical protein